MAEIASNIVNSETKETLDQLKKSAEKIRTAIQSWANTWQEIPESIVERFLTKLDKILALDPEYPVYQFLPELGVNIEFDEQDLMSFAQNKNREINQTPIEERDDAWEFYYRNEFEKYLESGSTPPKNNEIDFYDPTFVQILNSWYDLQNQKPNFSTYIRLYDTKKRIAPNADDVNNNDFASSHVNSEKWFGKDNVLTLWGGIDLTKYTKGRQQEFLQQKTRIDLGAEATRDVIIDLFNNAQVVDGKASEHFLDEVRIRPEDLNNEVILRFICHQICLDPEQPYIQTRQNRIFTRFFDTLKLNLENLGKKLVIEILHEFCKYESDTVIGLLSDIRFTKENLDNPTISNLFIALIKDVSGNGYSFVAKQLKNLKFIKDDFKIGGLLPLIAELSDSRYSQHTVRYDFDTALADLELQTSDINDIVGLKDIFEEFDSLAKNTAIKIALIKRIKFISSSDFKEGNYTDFWTKQLDFLCKNNELAYPKSLVSQIDFNYENIRLFEKPCKILKSLINHGGADFVEEIVNDMSITISDFKSLNFRDMLALLTEHTEGKIIFSKLTAIIEEIKRYDNPSEKLALLLFIEKLTHRPEETVGLLLSLEIDNSDFLNDLSGYKILSDLATLSQGNFVKSVVADHRPTIAIFNDPRGFAFTNFIRILIQNNLKDTAFEIISNLKITQESIKESNFSEYDALVHFFNQMLEVGETDYVVNILEKVNFTAEMLQLETESHFNRLFIKLIEKGQAQLVIDKFREFIERAFLENCKILSELPDYNILRDHKDPLRCEVIKLVLALQDTKYANFAADLKISAGVNIIPKDEFEYSYFDYKVSRNS